MEVTVLEIGWNSILLQWFLECQTFIGNASLSSTDFYLMKINFKHFSKTEATLAP